MEERIGGMTWKHACTCMGACLQRRLNETLISGNCCIGEVGKFILAFTKVLHLTFHYYKILASG